MTAYVALLRGVNVGGRNTVPMESLRKDMVSLGFEEGSTYLQSGNAVFRVRGGSAEAVQKALEGRLARYMTTEPVVALRDSAQMARVVKGAPFRGPERQDTHRYVTFLERAPKAGLRPPENAPGLEHLVQKPTEVYSAGHPLKGRYGYPGPALEKALGVRATTRTWAVVQELARRAAALDK